jgi:hypothetical protein
MRPVLEVGVLVAYVCLLFVNLGVLILKGRYFDIGLGHFVANKK